MSSISEIIGEVACVTGIPAPAITGRSKTKHVARARHLAIAAVRVARPWWSMDELALAFDRVCHATITCSFRRYAHLYQTDQEFRHHARNLDLPPFLT